MQSKIHKHKFRERQQHFDLSYKPAIKEPLYNALVDPHAEYYFKSKCAKRRIKKLKGQIKKDRTCISQSKKTTKMINDKLKVELPKINKNKVAILDMYDVEKKVKDRKISQQATSKFKSARGLSKKSSINTLRKSPAIIEQDTNYQSQNRQTMQPTTMQDKKQIKHDDFLKFLDKKRVQVLIPKLQ